MKRRAYFIFAVGLAVILMLTACTPAQSTSTTQSPSSTQSQSGTESPSTTTAAGKEVTATIGFTSSQTGNLTTESTRQTNGLNLWMKQVNDSGGLKLSDGTVVKFQAKSYDDESSKDRVQELYTRLATDDNATFMISPYSSGLADAAAVVAEQYQRIMITTGAASVSTYQKGYTLVYQAYTPSDKYLTGAVDLLAKTDPSVKKIAIVHENDKFSTDVSNAAKSYAESKGYEVVLFEGYDTATADFAPFINKITEAAPDAILGGGHVQDGTTFAKQLFEKNVNVKFITLLVAPPEPTFADIGDAALGIVGPSQWEPLAAFTEEGAKTLGIEWFGPTGDSFISDYKAAYNEEPSYHSAGGYAAGLILQHAIEKAGSLDTQAVKAALDSMDGLTFFGHIKFNTTADSHGLQEGHSMVYIQWQKDASGALVKQVVWPEEAVTAQVLYPLHQP